MLRVPRALRASAVIKFHGLRLLGTALTGIALLSTSCARETSPEPPRLASNLLIVTIDTLRADRLGVYGATNVRTPQIDRLASEGAWAPQATVQVPLTRPSHVSIFTGLYPAEHGIRDNIAPPLDAGVPLLATLLERDKFATAAFVASAVLDRQSGLARGFSFYSDHLAANVDRRPGDEVTREAIDWLRGKDRFFAWVHLYDVHAPYQPPEPYRSQYAGRPYDGTVAWADDLVGRLVDALRAAGTLDRTLVIVTSDHGEGLGDHGEDVHGYFIYEATLRVPLVLRGPGVKPGSRIAGVARSIDLFPTIVELMGIAAPNAPISGRSLVAALGGQRPHDEPSFSESLVPLLHYGWSDLRAVRDGRWKYILAPRPELYDLERDPAELHNLVEAEPARASALNAALKERLQREQKTARTAPASSGVPPELLEKLGALGYVSPGRPSGAHSTGADPKDKLDEYKALSTTMQDGLVALRSGRAAEAIDRFQSLTRRGMDSYELHYYLARAHTSMRRWREAAAEYDRALQKLPGDAAAWRGLGESRVELKDSAGAARAFEKLVTIAPDDAVARMQLGEVYRDMGRWEDAISAMRGAIGIDPRPAQYWNALGTVLGGGKRMAEAERAFAEAVSREPGNAMYLFNHALALQQLGRRDEAIPELRRSATLGYQPAAAFLRQLGVVQ